MKKFFISILAMSLSLLFAADLWADAIPSEYIGDGKWVTLKTENGYFFYALEEDNILKLGHTNTAPTASTCDAYLWQIEGNETLGYTFRNHQYSDCYITNPATLATNSQEVLLSTTASRYFYVGQQLQLMDASQQPMALYLAYYSRNYHTVRLHNSDNYTGSKLSFSLVGLGDGENVVTGSGAICTLFPQHYLVNADAADYAPGIPASTPFEMEIVVENTVSHGFNEYGSTILATTSNPHENTYNGQFQLFHHASSHDRTPNTLNFKANMAGDQAVVDNVTNMNYKVLVRYDGFYTYTIRTTILDGSLNETASVFTRTLSSGGNVAQSTITMMSSALPVGINIKSLKIRLYPISLNQNTLGTDPDGKYYGSIFYPVAFELPDGVAAYKLASATDGDFLLSLVAQGGEVLPQNTPAILVSNSAVEGEFMITSDAGVSVADNLLSGSVTAVTRDAQQTTYILSGKQGIGFYQYTGATIPAFKAYYESASPLAPARFAFRFEDEEQVATGLEETSDCELSASASIYDLMGCPVAADRLLKGHFYIVNGTKILY